MAGIAEKSIFVRSFATGSLLAIVTNEMEERVRNRIVVVGLALVVALALVTGSVLLVGYAAATASALIIVSLLVRKVLRGGSASPIESPVPRWGSEEREAA
jgi:Flp pilus assembly protein protease CpaA